MQHRIDDGGIEMHKGPGGAHDDDVAVYLALVKEADEKYEEEMRLIKEGVDLDTVFGTGDAETDEDETDDDETDDDENDSNEETKEEK